MKLLSSPKSLSCTGSQLKFRVSTYFGVPTAPATERASPGNDAHKPHWHLPAGAPCCTAFPRKPDPGGSGRGLRDESYNDPKENSSSTCRTEVVL